MIKSFNHKGLEKFFTTGSTAGIQDKHAGKLRRRLAALNAANSPQDLNVPSWRLHMLKGNLADHWAITVNANWRLTFKFDGVDVILVDYQDYH